MRLVSVVMLEIVVELAPSVSAIESDSRINARDPVPGVNFTRSAVWSYVTDQEFGGSAVRASRYSLKGSHPSICAVVYPAPVEY